MCTVLGGSEKAAAKGQAKRRDTAMPSSFSPKSVTFSRPEGPVPPSSAPTRSSSARQRAAAESGSDKEFESGARSAPRQTQVITRSSSGAPPAKQTRQVGARKKSIESTDTVSSESAVSGAPDLLTKIDEPSGKRKRGSVGRTKIGNLEAPSEKHSKQAGPTTDPPALASSSKRRTVPDPHTVIRRGLSQ